jgi:hypothetical protein
VGLYSLGCWEEPIIQPLDTRAVFDHSMAFHAIISHPTICGLMSTSSSFSSPFSDAGLRLGDVLAAPWLNWMGDLSR